MPGVKRLSLCDREKPCLDQVNVAACRKNPTDREPRFAKESVEFPAGSLHASEEHDAQVGPAGSGTAAGVTTGPALTAEILSFLGQTLAMMKLPGKLTYVDALPRDPAGKLFKRRLRERMGIASSRIATTAPEERREGAG